MALPRPCLRRKCDRYQPINFAFFPAPAKGCAQYYKFAASGRRLDWSAPVGCARIRLLDPPLNILFAVCVRNRRYILTAEEINKLVYRPTDQVGTSGCWSMNLAVVG